MSEELAKPYRTADLGLVSYLCTKGMVLLGTVKSDDEDQQRMDWILIDREDRDRLVQEWISRKGDAAICQLYFTKMRLAKRALFEEPYNGGS